jgi:glutaconyl-CoA/methylmalonyl-CoA decarboxylase subunit gamma
MEEIKIKVKGKEYKVKIEETDGKVKVFLGDETYEVDAKSDIEPLFADSIIGKEDVEDVKGAVKAPLPGTIISINVKAGDIVKKGDSLVKLIAMKMENEITATSDGKVKEIKVKKDDVVQKGDILMVVE